MVGMFSQLLDQRLIFKGCIRKGFDALRSTAISIGDCVIKFDAKISFGDWSNSE